LIKHIVMWTVKESADSRSKSENLFLMKALLEELPGKIPQIRAFEVSINMYRSDPACDIVLYSEFDSAEDFEIYRTHPDHETGKNFVAKVRDTRAMVDYEV